MSKVSTHLYALAFFNFFIASFNLADPFCLFRLPSTIYISELTGLKIGPRSRSHEIAMGLKMYIITIIYLWGARKQIRGVRTCAFWGMVVYACGALLTCLVKPELDGAVILLITGVIYALFVGWMLLDKGMAREAKEFIVELRGLKASENKKQ